MKSLYYLTLLLLIHSVNLNINSATTSTEKIGELEMPQEVLKKVLKSLSTMEEINAPINAEGNTFLMYNLAVGYGANVAKIVRAILNNPNNKINVADTKGKTALHYAFHIPIEFIKLLLDSGADINAADNLGYTPLMRVASLSDKEDLFQLLLDYGADIDKVNTHGDNVSKILAAYPEYTSKKVKLLEESIAKRPLALERRKTIISALNQELPISIILLISQYLPKELLEYNESLGNSEISKQISS